MKSALPKMGAPWLHALRPARVCMALLLLLAPTAALAYLDPSTGSMVVSAIVGIAASIALAVKTYWYKIKAFFRRGGRRDAAQESPKESPYRESSD